MKTSVFVGTSLDGFIARENGSFDFLTPYEVVENGWEKFMTTVDCVVLGRKTYETALSIRPWMFGRRFVAVLSGSIRTLRAPPGAVCTAMNCSPAEVLAQLSDHGLQHAYVDGGMTIQRFLRDGLIQYITISRYPVLIGSGRALFGSLLRDVPLKHLGTRTFPNGFVRSRYRVLAPALVDSSRRNRTD
ncbi:MAG: dihydrofolate reductase family protein [Thermoplasmata archaeon]